jgi:hypothetical protein
VAKNSATRKVKRGTQNNQAALEMEASPPVANTLEVEVSKVNHSQSVVLLLYLNQYIDVGGAVSDETISQRSAVQKSDFRILRTIGRGTYGKVYLVQHNQTQ